RAPAARPPRTAGQSAGACRWRPPCWLRCGARTARRAAGRPPRWPARGCPSSPATGTPVAADGPGARRTRGRGRAAIRTSSDCSAAVDGCSWLAPLQGAPELARPPRATLVIRQGRHRGRRGGNPRKLSEIKRVRARMRRPWLAPARPVCLVVDRMGNRHSTAACLPWSQEMLHMLTVTEMLTTLRPHPLPAGLAEGTFQEVCRLAIQRRLETGECLLHQGKPADRFYVLIQEIGRASCRERV